MHLDASNGVIQAVNYFIYDSIKILFLLAVMIFVIAVIRTYLPVETLKKWLEKSKSLTAHFFAALFGAITPFCSCSSIPIFISFIKMGIPLGAAFSFLVTSPLVNEYLVVLMWSLFGWKITIVYVITGILLGMISGFILGKMKLEKYLVKDVAVNTKKAMQITKYNSFSERLKQGRDESISIVKKLWIWILLGVAVGAGIHNLIPESVIHDVIESGGILAVPIAVLIGVPLYGSCAAILPIALALFQKGVPLGTALAFMMAISALSLPEAIILRRVMNLRLIAIFFGIVAVLIVVIGYLFNAAQIWLI
jgi:uncharacterized membrane protein YraQ (UPF0718 family)